ncbi:hypothetical protein D9M72_462110 [compost metagenome]
MDELRVGTEGGRDILRAGHVHRCDLDAVVRQDAPSQFVSAGIADVAKDQVVTFFQETEKRGADGCHARCRRNRVVGSFQGGEPLF